MQATTNFQFASDRSHKNAKGLLRHPALKLADASKSPSAYIY